MRDKLHDHFSIFVHDTQSVSTAPAAESYMVEIFIIQFVAAALGAASTAMADWMYRSNSIRRRLHSFWVSASITGICLPVLIWTCNVFLGLQFPGRLVVAILVGTIFFCVYRDLQKSPSVQNLDGPLPQHPSSRAVPPTSRLNG
jgi:hypothetical protein